MATTPERLELVWLLCCYLATNQPTNQPILRSVQKQILSKYINKTLAEIHTLPMKNGLDK